MISMRHLFFLLLGIVLVCLLSGCRRLQRVAYYHSQHLDPAGWRCDRPIVFSPTPPLPPAWSAASTTSTW